MVGSDFGISVMKVEITIISLTLLLSLYTTTLNFVDVTKTSRVMISSNCSLHYSSPLCFPLSGTSLRC